ncbi:hypothetical protein GOV12_04345, partial [Candidatus Pacearchaeota archaeon]|nr:hypothetical protein [Candidatus Pacearchaeota archaeon]
LSNRANNLLDSSWKERHSDNYRTETYTDTESYTDSNGNSQTRTVTKTRQVYDDTDHYFYYYDTNGKNASNALDILVNSHDTINLSGAVLLASKTNKEGMEAAEKSRKKLDEDFELTHHDAGRIANTWYVGSTFRLNETRACSVFPILTDDNSLVKRATLTVGASINDRRKGGRGDKFYYNTGSHSHPGPIEYQSFDGALTNTGILEESLSKIFSTIAYNDGAIPRLKSKLDVLRGSENIEVDVATEEIMDLSKEIYAKNFQGGFDVSGFRKLPIFLWSLLGLGGIGVGIPAGIIIDRKKDSNRSRRRYY